MSLNLKLVWQSTILWSSTTIKPALMKLREVVTKLDQIGQYTKASVAGRSIVMMAETMANIAFIAIILRTN